MPPKKDKKKKDEPAVPELTTVYVAREPQPQPEPPDVSEADEAWKAARNQYVLPLPEWNMEAVDTTEWKPNETETMFISDQFSGKALPRSFTGMVSGWRRAGAAALAKGELLPEEQEPQAQPLPEIKVEPEEVPDPKAKAKAKADAKAKAKAKGAPVEEENIKATTMQQYADCDYSGEARVVSQQEFRSREVQLDMDDAAPQLSQAIAAQFAIIAEHKSLMPKGHFLWELIYPQDEEGMPLFNPHGKYIIKLFLQGRWRQVLIDDVVPVGFAMHGGNVYAPVLPASPSTAIIWPQLLAKGLLRAFQEDLVMSVLPCISALTGWMPYQLPVSWNSIKGLHTVRTFCSLQMTTQVDMEARQRAEFPAEAPVPSLNLSGGASSQPVPKLGGQPLEAAMEFLLCEIEEEPRQVRIKASDFMPQHGTPRKHAREVDSEEEDGSADEAVNEEPQPARTEEEVEDSDREETFDEDEEETSPPQDAANGAQSARSKEGGSQDGEGDGEGEEEQEEEDQTPWVAPWPEDNPPPLTMKSEMQKFQSQLQGGFWVSFEELVGSAEVLTSYIPPSDHVITASVDTSWSAARSEAFRPPSVRLLRFCLVPGPEAQRVPRTSEIEDLDSKPPPGPPWLQTVLTYEPLLQTNLFSEASSLSAACNVVLKAVNGWRPASKPVKQTYGQAPESIVLTVGDGQQPGMGMAFQSLLLPPGEHWYLVLDDANEMAGSSLSVSVEGLLLNAAKSSIQFMEPAHALQRYGLEMLDVGPMEYPIHTGYRVWTKAEVLISSLEAAESTQSIQLLCHVTDSKLWPYLQLICLHVCERDKSDDVLAEERCASWSVTTLLKSPLLRVMSVPLSGSSAVTAGMASSGSKFVLMLEANLPPEVLAKTGGQVSMQLFMPPSTGSDGASSVDLGEDGSDPGGEAAPAEEADGEAAAEEGANSALQLQLLNVDHVMRWQGECAPNDKGLILCERITVPVKKEGEDNGDVTSTLRITVEGLPQAFLQAKLVAQMPPTDDMRPPKPDGEPLEPLVPGQPINPRDYSGRRNWISRCKTVAKTSGLEIVSFPHVLLTEASTYILYVHLDNFRGPGVLEGGTWQLESFGSGPIEVGADAMEQDLEELVRQSWAEGTPQEGDQPPRHEVAAASREKWLAKRNGEVAEDEAEAGEDKEKLVLDAALSRAKEAKHPNIQISDFLHCHAEMDAVLSLEDPYTVAPDRPEWKPAEDTDPVCTDPADVTGDPTAEDTEEAVAVKALGTDGDRKARDLEIEATSARWQVAGEALQAAKERNANQIQEMRQWRENRCNAPGGAQAASFAPTRDSLRGALQSRMEKCASLKLLVFDKDRTDPEPLRVASSEADAAGARNYDAELMENAGCKLRVLDAGIAFLEALTMASEKIEASAAATAAVEAAEPGSEGSEEAAQAAAIASEEAAAAAKALEASLSELKASNKLAGAKSLPVPEEILKQEPMEKAAALLEQQKAAAELEKQKAAEAGDGGYGGADGAA